MAYSKTTLPANFHWSSSGLTTYKDVYNIIREVDKEYEFYEIEPAIVKEVMLNPEDFPILENGEPDFSFYGTIKARFLHSQKDDDILAGLIKPISPHMIAYPLVGELVNISEYGGQLYYTNPLNLRGMVNMNKVNSEIGDNKVLFEGTRFNRKIEATAGDLVINSRFGSSIKMGSDSLFFNPILTISNNQYNAEDQNELKVIDPQYFHVQNLNIDGSTIKFTSGDDKLKIIFPSTSKNLPSSETGLSGNIITIISDKLIFSARKDDVHIFANRNINLTTNSEINLETGEDGVITLGDADTLNPIVKGLELKDILVEILDSLEEFCSKVSVASGALKEGSNEVDLSSIGGSAAKMQKQLEAIEDKIVIENKFFSKRNFTV